MKNLIFITLSLISFCSFSQSGSFIEIAVSETVELLPKSVIIHIEVEGEFDQRMTYYRKEFGYDEFDDYGYEFEYDEEDWIYEEMLEESPKKITKEMREAYEERARKRKEMQEERERRDAEFEQKWESQGKVSVNEVYAKIKALGLPTKIIQTGEELSFYELNDLYDNDYEDEYNTSDSVIQVILSTSDDWDKLNTNIADLPVDMDVDEIEYNTLDDQYETIIPKLTQKAQSQAQMLAKSMNRKLGKILECTNVYPYTPSKHMMATYTNELERIFENRSVDGDPFSSTRDEIIEYVYKFELF